MQNVVSGQILRSGTDRHLGLVDLEADLGPLSDRVKTDTSSDQNLSEVLSFGFESVSSNSQRSLIFVGLNKIKDMLGREQIEEQLENIQIVVVALVDV